MTRAELLADAQQRKMALEASQQSISGQLQVLNAQGRKLHDAGVKAEQELFGVEGEIKALTAMGESVG